MSQALQDLDQLHTKATNATKAFIAAVAAHTKGMTFTGVTAYIDGDKSDEHLSIEVHSSDGESFEISGGAQGVSFDGRSSDFALHLEAVVADRVLEYLDAMKQGKELDE